MDNMEYLNQISASNRPAKTGMSGLFSMKFMLIIGGIAIFAILIIIIGSLSGGNNKGRDLAIQIDLRSTNLITTIGTYNKQVKSSELRSMASSLSSVLTETTSKLSPLIESTYDIKPNKYPTQLTEQETSYAESLNTDLENARLNGLLDRNYVRILTLQTGLLMSMESDCLSRTKNTDIKNVLNNSYVNLANIYESLSSYSDSTS